MSVEMAKVPAWMETPEFKELQARQQKLADTGEIALLELTPANKVTFGGFGIMGKIKDKYRNVVLDTANVEDRVGIPPMGLSLRINDAENLKYIYAILNCPIIRNQCVVTGETPIKNQHRFVINDAEFESKQYAEGREQSIKYQNKLYTEYNEETINLLCTIAGLATSSSLGVKRADLCRVWDSNPDMKAKIKSMMDSPDMPYFEAAYKALSHGSATEGKGFYKTQNGVYKHNEQILGNSMENVIAYLKTKDEVFVALKKGEEANKKPVEKPKQ
jgi:hypothetical protein